MEQHSEREETQDGIRPTHSQQNTSQDSGPSRPRPRRSSTSTSLGSTVMDSMRADPKTAHHLHNIMSQLDSDGKAQLVELASHVANGTKRKGRVDDETYRELNPWHDKEKDEPVFSLGEPLPHTDEDYHQRNPWHGQVKERPVFSLGEPLPHTVRKGRSAHAEATQKEEDVEQGLRKRPTKSTTQQEQDTAELHHSDDTLHGSPQAKPPRTAHHTEQDEGTDMAQKFQIDGDNIGGPREDQAVEEGKVDVNDMRNYWARFRAKYPEPLAEFFCTGVSVFLGVAASLSVNLSQSQPQQYGSWETLCWAWGFAFMFGIYLGGGVSGAHMNPAISVSLSVFRGFPWRRCVVYISVQIVGGFVGGMVAYGIFGDAIREVDPTMTQTYSSWFTVPKPWISPATAFFNEFLGGAVLLIVVLSLGDDQNNPPGAGMHAFIIGLLITVLKMTLGYNTGAALNPASDLGPRIVAYAAGYRTDDMWRTGWFAYGPIAGTLSGALVGCSLYDLVVFVGSESPINYRWSKERHIMRVLFHKRK